MPRIPVLLAVADIEEEILQDLPPVPGMDDFGVELDAVEASSVVRDSGNGTGIGLAEHSESGGHRLDRIPMAHPDLLRTRGVPEQRYYLNRD